LWVNGARAYVEPGHQRTVPFSRFYGELQHIRERVSMKNVGDSKI